MIRTFNIALLSLVAALAFNSIASADAGVGVVFSKDEISIIAAWYRDHGSASRHNGHGKKSKGLPPGIARNLARGKALPPGIAKQHLPQGLISALPAPPRGYERVIVDGRVLLVEIATRVIHDVLVDVVLR